MNSLVRNHWLILGLAKYHRLCVEAVTGLGAMWVGTLMDKKKTGPSPSCRPVGSEVGAKPSGSVKERGFSCPRVGETARKREVTGRKAEADRHSVEFCPHS